MTIPDPEPGDCDACPESNFEFCPEHAQIEIDELREEVSHQKETIRQLDNSRDEAMDRTEKELARLDTFFNAAKGLLAVTHRDGGHHTGNVGFLQSCQDASAEIHRLRTDLAAALERAKLAEEQNYDISGKFRQEGDDLVENGKALCDLGQTAEGRSRVMAGLSLLALGSEWLMKHRHRQVMASLDGVGDRLGELISYNTSMGSDEKGES